MTSSRHVTVLIRFCTVTTQVAVLPPSVVVTVMFAVPAATAVIMPSATVAMFSSSLDQVTLLSVAVSGLTVAVSVAVSPTVSVSSVWSSATLPTASGSVK